ncbi:uncharacterized protein GIQ15_00335 [Arthroderma uncinatum]|uniref:uncharacterized protein n=1 Tax=Arthroderma uncinatum TaxID=74035 RepID=UPI00144AC81E|nr:uncharacterized protein GIQ15_00335 [Arthroderma uncinatum]KAF3490818.1 hypothetical protein GIQ15_00335 [Arthroderma uncinatum]
MYHYPSPPSGWSTYDGYTPPSPHYSSYYGPPPAASASASASAAAAFAGSPHATPRTKKHAYRASFSGTKEGAGWHQPSPAYGHHGQHYQYSWQPQSPSQAHPQAYDRPEYFSTPRKHEHVSHEHHHSQGYGYGYGYGKQTQYPPHHHHHHYMYRRKMPVADSVSDGGSQPDLDDREHDHGQPRYRRTYTYRRAPTNHYHCPQTSTAAYDDPVDTPKRSRARRASTYTRPTHRDSHASKPNPAAHAPPPKSPPRATEADAIHHNIPPGYSIKNWNPKEAPILLLGSVFDANSLGKWIYDWTAFHHGATAPMADVAGDLWLLLIKLSGKVKRADECAPLIRSTEAREMVEDFLESGERLWSRFKRLLKACEHFMWKAAKRENASRGGSTTGVTMGRNAGCEFVDSIFGRDRELENTEKLMNSVRLWNMRFDANCGDLLREVSK